MASWHNFCAKASSVRKYAGRILATIDDWLVASILKQSVPRLGLRSFGRVRDEVRVKRLAVALPAAPADIARTFKGARSDRIEEVLATLAALGQARIAEGKFAAIAQ